MSSQPKKYPQQTRPRTYEVTIKSILSFPFRICNPPPAVGKVRSCGVTPLFKVRLEDVLDRQHLPPLGLKDFEEWLLFVEMSPENLYFTLWLREYRLRYNEWVAQTKFQRDLDSEFRINWTTQYSSSLAMFYARAKQTFFTPNSPYELNLPSSLLAVFHTSTESPHPDPAVFTDVAIETYRMLDESLRRFVSAQFNNVGNNRVLCGIIAGVFFALLGSIPPIVLNFTRNDTRWMRLVAFPGLFLGITILIAALNGICLGVYVFGDLRQLRKFELARPPISKPQPVPNYDRKLHSFDSQDAPTSNATLPNDEPTTHIAKSPSATDARVAHLTRPPSVSTNPASIRSSSESVYINEDTVIHISPAYFDSTSAEGHGNGAAVDADYTFPSSGQVGGASRIDPDFTSTATFIHPFDTTSIDFCDTLEDRTDYPPERRQPISAFDFDSLPSRARKSPAQAYRYSKQYERDCCDSATVELPSPTYPAYPSYPSYPQEPQAPAGFISRLQTRCDIKKWRLQTESTDYMTSPTSSFSANPYNSHIPKKSRMSVSIGSESTETKVRKRFRLIKAVPAFAVPLTRVLSPVVRRGQWEIVVRSAMISFVISWAVVGTLLAVPLVQ